MSGWRDFEGSEKEEKRTKDEAVSDDELHAGVLEGALVDGGEPLLSNVNDSAIDLDHHAALNGLVLEDFLNETSVSATNDQHTFRCA